MPLRARGERPPAGRAKGAGGAYQRFEDALGGGADVVDCLEAGEEAGRGGGAVFGGVGGGVVGACLGWEKRGRG